MSDIAVAKIVINVVTPYSETYADEFAAPDYISHSLAHFVIKPMHGADQTADERPLT